MRKLTKDQRRMVAGLALMAGGAAVLVGALPGGAGAAVADHVDPILIEETRSQTCGDLADEFGGGQTWLEVKLDPAEPGEHEIVVEGFGTITVTVDDNTKVVDWESDFGIDAVFLKAGAAGSNLYVYAATADAPEAFGDTGLTTPGEGEANQISHISFCYDEGEVTTTTSTTTTSTTTSTTVQDTTSTTAAETTTTTAAGETTTTAPVAGELPVTGSGSGPMVAMGAALLAGGGALVGFARRFRHS
jgi:LPXTG-motif cell wall-anchored protein